MAWAPARVTWSRTQASSRALSASTCWPGRQSAASRAGNWDQAPVRPPVRASCRGRPWASLFGYSPGEKPPQLRPSACGPFFQRAVRVLVGPHRRGIQQQLVQPRFVLQSGQGLGPHAAMLPAEKNARAPGARGQTAQSGAASAPRTAAVAE